MPVAIDDAAHKAGAAGRVFRQQPGGNDSRQAFPVFQPDPGCKSAFVKGAPQPAGTQAEVRGFKHGEFQAIAIILQVHALWLYCAGDKTGRVPDEPVGAKPFEQIRVTLPGGHQLETESGTERAGCHPGQGMNQVFRQVIRNFHLPVLSA